MPPRAAKQPAPEKPKIPAIIWSPELIWMLISTAEAPENRNVMVGKLKEDVSSTLQIKYLHGLTFTPRTRQLPIKQRSTSRLLRRSSLRCLPSTKRLLQNELGRNGISKLF